MSDNANAGRLCTNRLCGKALERLYNGDTTALTVIYDCLGRQIYMLALSVLGDRAYAEDAMQDTFLKIIGNISTYHTGGNATAWIMAVARNSAIDILKRRNRVICIDDVDKKADFADSEDIAAGTAIRDALDSLDGDDRQIVILHSVSGLSHKEISKIMGMSTGCVQKRYQRARNRLHKLLG